MSEEFDVERLEISPLDEVDALELREFLVESLEDFWGDTNLTRDHAPHWFRQFAAAGLVARYKNELVGYLLGAIPVEGPALVHLVAVRDDFRHNGIGRVLYEAFLKHAAKHGAEVVQATALPENTGAISFHSSLGFDSELIDNYAGPDSPRVLFTCRLGAN